jgi:nucleoside-diphosphate-sugar epimerase
VRVLVTGGGGFIGSNLVRACLEAGDEVRVLDDFSTGRRDNLRGVERDVELVQGSVVEPESVRAAVTGREVVYHQAAMPSVPRSLEDPVGTHAVNATGTLQVLEASRRAGVRRVVYAASSSAYGDTETLPKHEDMPPRPLSPYALQKLVGEIYCQQYTRLFGLETLALRYFNVYGPRQNPDSPYAAVIPRFVRAAAARTPPTVFGDGLQSRDFTFVADVVAANRAAAVASAGAAGRVLNVARGGRVTLLELWREICAAVGCEPYEPDFRPARAGDVRHSQADITRARELLGWEPRASLRDGLDETVRWLLGERERRCA